MGGCGHLPRKGSWIHVVGTPVDSIVDGIFLIVYSVLGYDAQIFDGQRGETGWKMKYGVENLVFTQSSYSCMGYTVAHSPRPGSISLVYEALDYKRLRPMPCGIEQSIVSGDGCRI